MFYFYIINYFLLFLIMNSTWAHINSTFIIFYYEQYPRSHMNSVPGPTWTVPPAPRGATAHESAPNPGALV